MTDHAPLPVHGYTAQPSANTDLANEGKVLEEMVLQYIEKVVAHARSTPFDQNAGIFDDRARCAAKGRTEIQDGFMWVIRAIFNPQRFALPADTPPQRSS